MTKVTKFNIGDVLRFSEKGLSTYAQGDKRKLETCPKWRFLVVEISDVPDRWGNKCLLIERLDLGTKRKQVWTPIYFEKVES